MAEQVPELLGRCRLKEKLGEGAMGVVYLAEHITLQIPVAVKVLSGHVVETGVGGAHRFIREARIAAKLNHPNIVRVYDCGRQGGLYYLVMAYIEGETCRGRLEREGRFEWREAVSIIATVAAALKSAADQGVIHRDVKPDNIMIDPKGIPQITDLGVAKITLDIGASPTVMDSMLGTPHYISPEQIRDARRVDFRSDIYSLGATLYDLVCGEPPFDGTSMYEVVNKHINDPVPSPRLKVPDLPQALCDIIARTMVKDPNDRYQTYDALIEDLQRVLSGEHVRAHVAEAVPPAMAVPPPLAVPRPPDLRDFRGGRPFVPADIPATGAGAAAGLAAYGSVLGFALAALIVFHAFRLAEWPAGAWAFALAAVGAYAAHTLGALRAAGEPVHSEAEQAPRARFLSLARMFAGALRVPEPVVCIVPGGELECSSAGLLRRWVLRIPRAILDRLDPSGPEAVALLAREAGRFYYGHTGLLTLLDGPMRVFSCLVMPADGLCQIAAASGGRKRLAAQTGALLYLAVVAAALAGLFYAWFWFALGVAVFAAFGLVARALRGSSEHAADAFAAAVLGRAEPVQWLIARQVLGSPRRHAGTLREAALPVPSKKDGSPAEERAGQGDEARHLVSHFSESAPAAGIGLRACALLAGWPSAAQRLRALAGGQWRSPAALQMLERVLGMHGGLIGGSTPERRDFLPEPARMRPYVIMGLVAGLLASASIFFIYTQEGTASYFSFVLTAGLLALLAGWQGGLTFLRQKGAPEELSLSLLGVVIFLMLSCLVMSSALAAAGRPLLLGQTPIVFALTLMAVSGGAMVALRIGGHKQ